VGVVMGGVNKKMQIQGDFIRIVIKQLVFGYGVLKLYSDSVKGCPLFKSGQPFMLVVSEGHL
jgi:hypothetical protein